MRENFYIYDGKKPGYKNPHDEHFHNLYVSPYIMILSIIQLRRMRQTGHVERMEKTENAYTIFTKKPEAKKQHLRYADVHGK